MSKIRPQGLSPSVASATYAAVVVPTGLVSNDPAAAAANTAAINAALTEAAAAQVAGSDFGGLVVIPAGKFSFAGEISVPTFVDLRGSGKFTTMLTATDAAACVRFGTMGGGVSASNLGGMSGHFRLWGADVATTLMKVGLTVARQFESIDIARAVGDGMVIDQAQNCAFLLVDSGNNGGSGVALDYGAGGNAFYKCEFNLNGYANGRTRYSAAVTGPGYPTVSHNLFSHCLFEGTKASTVAAFAHEAGTRTVFQSVIMSLLSGANGHADLYGTDIPVLLVRKAHADGAAVSNRVYLTGGTHLIGSKPSASTAYLGTGIQVENTPGEPAVANVYVEGGTHISLCNVALKTKVDSRIDVSGRLSIASVTTRYGTTDGGSHTEATVVHNRTGALVATADDPALPVFKGSAATGQTGNLAELYGTSSAVTPVFSVSNAGTMQLTGNVQPIYVRTTSRGTVAIPSVSFTNDPDTGMWSPTSNQVALSAGGVEVFKATATKPALTYSRTGESAAEAQLRAALVALSLVTDNTTA